MQFFFEHFLDTTTFMCTSAEPEMINKIINKNKKTA